MMMYAKPTISPGFVVRQRRKLRRNSILIGAVMLFVLLLIGGVLASAGAEISPEPAQRDTSVQYTSRIIFEPTVQATLESETNVATPIVTANPVTPAPAPIIAQVRPLCEVRAIGDINVNIRSGPDLTFSVISILDVDNQIQAIQQSDTRWFQVANFDGTIGWVGGRVVQTIGDCDSLPQVQTPVCDIRNTSGNRVNLRREPTTDSNIIRTLSATDVLMADGQTSNGWYRILVEGRLAWVFQDVVALGDPCSDVPVIMADAPAPEPILVEADETFSDEDCVIGSFTGNPVDLHRTPDMTSAVVAKLNKTRKAHRLSNNGWYEIDGVGWAFAGDLVTRGLCRLLPVVAPEDVRGILISELSG